MPRRTAWPRGVATFQNLSDCVEKAMADYLTDLIVPPNGSVCQSNQQPFDPDFFVR